MAETTAAEQPSRRPVPESSSAPLELVPSRIKWWVMIAGGGAFAITMLLSSGGDIAAILIAALSAFIAAIGAIMLLPGANSLRLDAQGFQITHLFRVKSFRWSEVSDFGVHSLGQNGEVVAFKTAETHRSRWEKLNGALLGDRNACLPDTYGMAAEDLVRLMSERLNAATARR